MTERQTCYYEHIVVPEPEYANHAEVSADVDGCFLRVITDDYEGHAVMCLPLAIEVHRALGRAIESAKAVVKGDES